MNETKIAKWHLCPSLGTQISEQWATSFFNHWACSELQRSSVAVIWVFSWPATLPFLVAGSGSCVGRQGFLGSRGAKINIKTTDLGSNLGAFISYPHGLGWITSLLPWGRIMALVLHCSAMRPELSHSKEPHQLNICWKGSVSFQVLTGMLALPLMLLRLIVWPLLCCLLRNIGMGGSWGITMSFPALEPLLWICLCQAPCPMTLLIPFSLNGNSLNQMAWALFGSFGLFS